jgi:transcriptional regulator with XRE-family HTH domain
MKERGLRVRDIRRRSAGTITESYISEILKGLASNPSIEKLSALGRGLGVDPVDLFIAASGGSLPDDESRRLIDKSFAVRVLDMIRRIALSPELVDITREVGQLSDCDLDLARESLATLRVSRQGTKPD